MLIMEWKVFGSQGHDEYCITKYEDFRWICDYLFWPPTKDGHPHATSAIRCHSINRIACGKMEKKHDELSKATEMANIQFACILFTI